MSTHSPPADQPKTVVQHWQENRRPGGTLPTYEAVVLGRLGRLADRCALVVTSSGQAVSIIWAGVEFADWLQHPASNLPLHALPEEVSRPIKGIAEAALRIGEPASARCDRVAEGVVTSHGLTGVPLTQAGGGEPVILLHLDAQAVRTALAEALFSATELGMLALATSRNSSGAVVDFKVVALNDGAARMFGRPAAALQWQRLSDLIPCRPGFDPVGRLAEALSRSDRAVYEMSYPRADGSLLHLKVEAGAMGDLVGLTITDVGDIKQREESFRLLFDHNPLPMWLTHPDTGRFLAVNEAAIAHYGYDRDAFLDLRLEDLTALDKDQTDGEAVCRHLRVDASLIEVSLFERAMTFEGQPVQLGAAVDITESRRNESRIAHMAHHDALTGLPNRVLFASRLAEAVERHERGRGDFLLLCLDLDKFKIVNDTLGHPVGDALLCEAAARLVQCLREEDCVARLGGDEFAVLVNRVPDPDLIRSLTGRIISEMSRGFVISGHDCHIGTSIGVACMGQDGTDPQTLELCRILGDGGGQAAR